MSQPSIVIDGAQTYGSYTLTIGGVAFVADDVKISRPVATASDRTTSGLPSRSRYTLDFCEGTATLQIPTSGTRPKFGQTFSETFDAQIGAETFILMPVDFEADNEPANIRKMPVKFRKQNTDTVTTVA